MILKEKIMTKILDLFSISTLDLENLRCTLPGKEILKLNFYEIGLVVIFKEFIKIEKLRHRSNFYSITFEEFNKF